VPVRTVEDLVGRSRFRAAAAALAVAVLVLAGCTGGSGSGGAEGGGSTPSATGSDVNPVARADLADGGDLRWPLDQLPPNYNYNQLDGALLSTSQVMFALMPRPFTFTGDGTPSVNQDYFESIELTSEDPQVVTYDINPDAVWSDGTPITVADLAAQWRALNGSDPAYRISAATGYEDIASVEPGKNDKQAVVTYANRYTEWQGLFDPLYPASTNSDPDVFNTGWVQQPQVTAGPFRLQGIDPTAETITLERNPQWWGDRPVLDRIIYRTLDPDAQVDALLNGEIDFISVGPDVNKLQRAQGANGIEIRRARGPSFRAITLNGMSPVLSDVAVRRALAAAIDRQAITDALIGPLGGDPAKLDNHIFVPGQAGYQNNAGDLSEPDVKAANAHLDKAGWSRKGGHTRTKGGQELVIRFVIPSAVAIGTQEAQLVQGMLKQVGARVDIQTVPVADFFSSYIFPGDFDMTVFSLYGTPFPISNAASFYKQPMGGDIQQNYARIGTQEIDDLFAQAIQELNPDKARETANRTDALIWQEVHSLPLYQRPDIVAATDTLANYGAFGFASVRYQDIGFTK
jgi:peptide/nickel transport system substrate-binding protein